MTHKQAIDVLKDFNKQISSKSNVTRQTGCGKLACYLAISALEYRIPKKPEYVDVRFRSRGKHVSDGVSLDKCYRCPNCKTHIFHVFANEDYCQHCGQALDWELDCE